MALTGLRRRHLLLAALPAAAASTTTAQPVQQPRPQADDYFGTRVDDPFRHLEQTADPAVQAWMRDEATAARRALDATPGRSALRRRLGELARAAGTRVADVQRRPGGRVFFLRREPRDEQFRLWLRDGPRERLLLDPRDEAINYFAASRSGRWVAAGLSAGGSEDASLHVIDVASGRRVMGPISRAEYGNVGWMADDSGFFLTRLQELQPGMAPAKKYSRIRVPFIRLGQPADEAPVALAWDTPGVAVDEDQDSLSVAPLPGTPWAAGIVTHGTDRELALYLAPTADAAAGRARWRRLFTHADGVIGFEVVGDRLFVLTHRGAPRLRLLETSLLNPDLDAARTVVAEGDGVLTALARGADALYLTRRDGSASTLLRVPLGRADAAAETVALPAAGSINLLGDEPRLPGIWLMAEGWTAPRRIWQVAPQGGRATVQDTRLQPPPRLPTLPRYVAREVLVPAAGGVQVPLSIIHRRGLALDGRNPALLNGYAAYGMTEEPNFSALRLAWLEQGGVWAVANPRGSGAFGEAWYRAGWQASKPNSWRDFIACAEWLVAQGFTSASRLAIRGGSAGGILVGRAMTERPDLFAAVVDEVGVADAVRGELEPNGPSNIPEFGTHTTEAGFRALLAMSPYHHVQDGTAYPAVLLVHGANDPRVAVWQSLKFAARLRQAGARDVLLRLDFASGHGVGDGQSQALDVTADWMAFALARCRGAN